MGALDLFVYLSAQQIQRCLGTTPSYAYPLEVIRLLIDESEE